MAESEAFVVVSVVVDYSNGAQKIFSGVKVPGEKAWAGDALEVAAGMIPGLVLEPPLPASDRGGNLMLKKIDGLGGGDDAEWTSWLDRRELGDRLPRVGSFGEPGAPLVDGQTLLIKLVAKREPAAG